MFGGVDMELKVLSCFSFMGTFVMGTILVYWLVLAILERRLIYHGRTRQQCNMICGGLSATLVLAGQVFLILFIS